MANTPLFSGNWKMNLNHLEAIRLIQELSFLLEKIDFEELEISIHPPYTSLRSVQIVLDDPKMIPVSLGAQNCHFEESGAFTGEVSATMLSALDVKYVILGHSERREYFGETDEMIAEKIRAVLNSEMIPILAVGESTEERENGRTSEKIRTQLEIALADIKPKEIAEMVIAYEPIWAIGSGQAATPEDASNVAELIRDWIKTNKNPAASKSVRVQYGGSVKPINISDFMSESGIDGVLVGGASLTAKDFARIVAADM